MKEAEYVKITILADNTASPPYRAEHGFSALVETHDTDGRELVILFDTGRGVIFENASEAGIDLARVSDVVLSHGHYDHTDALPSVLETCPYVRIHASADIFTDHYSLRTGICRKIGLSDANRAVLSSLPKDRFLPFDASSVIPESSIHLAGRIERKNPLETPSPLLFADASCGIPDKMIDEIVLWTASKEGLVILTGCCHAGFINTCEHVRSISGISRIHAVIGGFHLGGVSTERLSATADYIERTAIQLVIPYHCTGESETHWLRERLGSSIIHTSESRTAFCTKSIC